MRYISGNSILAKLPPFEGNQELLVDNQDVMDIIEAVIQSHNMFANHYDCIWDRFYDPDINKVCKALFKFCHDQVPYNVESDKYQTIKSPAAMLSLAPYWGGDCKHYAGFIGGILDSIKRNTSDKINWTYRFASYDWWDETPEHVFVVLNPGKKNELWIDPVLQQLDQRDPRPKHFLDKKPKMSLTRISGVNQQRIGIAPIVVAALISTVPQVAAFVAKLFGKKEPESTGVRTLVALFRNNVVGNITDINQPVKNVSIQEADQAQAWFTAVLGVPIYDVYRWYALAGLSDNFYYIVKNLFTGEIEYKDYKPSDIDLFGNYSGIIFQPPKFHLLGTIEKGTFLNKSFDERIADYKRVAGPGETAQVSDAEILQAVKIADNMQAIAGVGMWKDLTVAPSSINEKLIAAYNAAHPDKPITMPTTSGTNINDIIKANPLATAGVVVVGGLAVYELTKQKKKMAGTNNNNNTLMYIGLGAAAIYLLVNKKSGTSNQPVYQPYPTQPYPTNSQQQDNVWSFLDSLADLAAGLFKHSGGGSGGGSDQYGDDYYGDYL